MTTIIDQPTQVYFAEQIATKCPEFTIKSREYEHDYSNSTCKPRPVLIEDCENAVRKYGKPPNDRECPKDHGQQIIADICRFTEASVRTSNKNKLKLECNLEPCGGEPVRIGVLQPNYGLLIKPEYWYIAKDQSGIDLVIRKILYENSQNGYDFCIMTCNNKKKFIKQVLVFPPFVKLKKKTTKNEKQKMNINIVVLDSVSRQHFYRQLPNTVQELKRIHSNTQTKVLDFEMLQSLAPRTFPNMRAMFSGIVDVDSDDESHTYGLDSLFGKYSNLGYQTVLQEDSCWFDSWGALITDNKHNMNALTTPDHYADRWQEIQHKLRNLPIDGYGLTHFTCDVFMKYGKTNQFNYPPKVCFNGQFLPAYFLNYTLKFLKTVEAADSAYPVFLYTHLNTGHEMSGKRISYSDLILLDYIKKISQIKNTMTIFLSDHGPKTTKFSQEYLAGRYEIGQALMFILMPGDVQSFLGVEKMAALETNQFRLISHVDLFYTLMSLHSNKAAGLFKPISLTRDCNDIPIYSFMTCLCDGWTQHLVEFHEQVHWLAEYAVGYLNNEITKSFHTMSHSYGNCERLIGRRYDKIRKKVNPNGKTVYTFDIIIDKYRDEEVFEVSITVTKRTHDLVAKITRWRRVSIFQHFTRCSDKNVDVQLCICRKESAGYLNPARDLVKLLSISSFNVETKLRFLDSKCLALLVRVKPGIFKSYEIVNLCTDRYYNFTFDLKSEMRSIKSSLGIMQNTTIKPWLIYYLISVSLYEAGSSDGAEITEDIAFAVVDITHEKKLMKQ